MRRNHFVVQSSDKPAQQLLLLFRGADDSLVATGKIGTWLAPPFPDALIISTGRTKPHGTMSGRQWLSVQGVTEESRQARVDTIMPVFTETVRYWQKHNGISPQATALISFSQEVIMSFESIRAELGLASWVIAFNGRCAISPEIATTATTIHLAHGGEDQVTELSHAVTVQKVLTRVGGDVTLNIIENLGHVIDERSIQFVFDHLRFIVPKHYFGEALSGGKPHDGDMIVII